MTSSWLRRQKEVLSQEVEHLDFAVRTRRTNGLEWLENAIAMAVDGLIWVSTRGDSECLAKALAH